MSSLFEDALDVPAWLERDRALSHRERVRRDRRLGLAIGAGRPAARVQAWWHAVEAADRPALGRHAARLRVWMALAVCVLGALLGAGVALAALRYDGQYPVNVLTALALLVAAPLALLLASLLLLPGRVPGLRGLQDALAAVNVGNLVASLVAHRSRAGLKLDWRGARGGPLARLAKWQIVAFSQLAGLSFALAALGTALALVVFTDLAFGWSTTLDVAARDVHRLVQAISWPWRDWLPAAVPDLALVETSRFFRLDGAPAVEPARLTGWWPFLLMTLISYALVPRAVVLVLAGARLRKATRDVLLADPAVRALLDRMDSAVVEGEGVEVGTPVEPFEPAAAAPAVRYVDPVGVVAWALAGERGRVEQWLATHVDGAPGRVVYAGGANALEADAEALRSFAHGARGVVLVLVKGWEPPLLDCMDLLAALRGTLDDAVSVIVVPLGLDASAPARGEVDVWRHAVGKLNDPGLYVEAVDDDGQAEGAP